MVKKHIMILNWTWYKYEKQNMQKAYDKSVKVANLLNDYKHVK